MYLTLRLADKHHQLSDHIETQGKSRSHRELNNILLFDCLKCTSCQTSTSSRHLATMLTCIWWCEDHKCISINESTIIVLMPRCCTCSSSLKYNTCTSFLWISQHYRRSKLRGQCALINLCYCAHSPAGPISARRCRLMWPEQPATAMPRTQQ